MRNNIWDKRLPTLFGIIVIIIGIGLTSILIKSGVIFETKATPSETPKGIRITNITDTSFTVSYSTDASVIGSISFGKDKSLSNIAIDDRDQNNTNVIPRKLHYITIRGLYSNTKYYFSITSGSANFLNNDVPFETVTGPAIESQPLTQQPIVGKILSPQGTSIDESIVYFISKSAQAISVLGKTDGNYILPLNSIRKEDLSSYFSIPQDANIKMFIISPSFQSNIILSTKQMSPVPPITLSQDYDFTLGSSPTSFSTESFGFPTLSATSSAAAEIISPKRDESFSDQQPLFKGTASPGSAVKIIIHSSEELKTQVIADNTGNWVYRPPTPLSPGEHNIFITTEDPSGTIKTLTQSFKVYAAGTQVNQSATPSASPSLSISPTEQPSPSPTPTTVPSPTPTLFLTSTPIPISTISPPGAESLLTAGLISLAGTTMGIALFLITRKSPAS